MDISAVIASDRVLRNVEARSKKHSLDIVSELLASADETLEQGDVFDSMIRREKLGCTSPVSYTHLTLPTILRV